MSKSSLESTWLYHEIGRCYLETGRFEVAKDYGDKAMEAAHDADDAEWKIHAGVLVAQALGTTSSHSLIQSRAIEIIRSMSVFFSEKLQDYSGAIASFERTLELAQSIEDEVAEQAIKSALSDLNAKHNQVDSTISSAVRAKSFYCVG